MSTLEKPRALTPATQVRIVESLAAGNFLSIACSQARVSRRCWYYWRRLVDRGCEHAQVYAPFFEACEQAMAIAEQAALRTIRSGAPGWQGSAWFLERRFPDRWGRRTTVTLRGVPKDLTTLTDDQLDDLERRIGGKGR
jgi:hypothetical protein